MSKIITDSSIVETEDNKHLFYTYSMLEFIDYFEYRLKDDRLFDHPILQYLKQDPLIMASYDRWLKSPSNDKNFHRYTLNVMDKIHLALGIHYGEIVSELTIVDDQRKHLRANRYTPEVIIGNSAVWSNSKRHDRLISDFIMANEYDHRLLLDRHRDIQKELIELTDIINVFRDKYASKLLKH